MRFGVVLRCGVSFFSLFLVFSVSVPVLFAFEWPLPEVEPTSTFGTYRHGSFFKAVEIEKTGEVVNPIDAGKLLFVASGRPRHGAALPRGTGNTMVVEHERGIRSVYGYLSDIPGKPGEWNLKRSEVLSSVGSTGSTVGDVLYLQILDSEFGQVVNPLVSLPSPEDSRAPTIESVALIPRAREGAQDGEKGASSGDASPERTPEAASVTLIPGERNYTEAGEYTCVVRGYDLSADAEFFRPMAPFTFRVYVNGEEKVNIRLEAITAVDFEHVIAGNEETGAAELYRDTWRYSPGVLRLNPGDAMIEVVLTDFAGNEAGATYRVTVR